MTLPVEFVLFLFLIVTAATVARVRDLFAAAMLLGIFSLISAGIMLLMDAVDVSFTEAAVGAGVSTVLVLSALSLTDYSEKASTQHRWTGKLVVVGTGALLIFGTLDMPHYGDPAAPIHHHVAPEYITGSRVDVQIPNVVTSVLASYRGFDTFGEVAVVFTAVVGAMVLLGGGRRRETDNSIGPDDSTRPGGSPGGGAMANPISRRPVRQNLILRVVAKSLFPFILLFALYVQFHGDFGPGGGFQAGVIFSAGWILYGLVFGLADLQRALPPRWVEIGAASGLLLYGGVGLLSLFLGGNFLAYAVLDPHSPVHGLHRGIFWIELGVGITVASVMVAIFYSFAGRGKQL